MPITPDISRSLFAPHAQRVAAALADVRDVAACEQAVATLVERLPRVRETGLTYLLAAVPALDSGDGDRETEAVVESVLHLISQIASIRLGGEPCRT